MAYDEKGITIALFRAIAGGIVNAIQVLMSDRNNINVYKAAIAFIIFVIIFTLEILQHYLGYLKRNLYIYSLLNLAQYTAPFVVYFIIWIKNMYNICHSKSNKHSHLHVIARRRIIFWYSLCMMIMLIWGIIAYSLLSAGIDGYCLVSLSECLLTFVFPLY